MRMWKSTRMLATQWSASLCVFTLSQVGFAQEAAPPNAATSEASPEKAEVGPPVQNAEEAATRAREEAEIAAELAKNQGASEGTVDGPSESRQPEVSGVSASSNGLSNLMNPAISVAGITLGGATSRSENAVEGTPDDLPTGISLQEVELRASAIVDPFLRADVSLSGSVEEVGFEEAYITTLGIPRLTVRAGQMRAALGRHNLLHTHAFPFITAPLPWRALIGPEGLTDAGVSAELLLPLPFYGEITGQLFQGDWASLQGEIADDPLTAVDESVPDRRKDRDLGYVAHLKTLFDLSESTTLELGTSYAGGRNGYAGLTTLLGGDVTLKWRPLNAERYTGIDWTTEYVWSDRDAAPVDRKRGGGYSALRFQFAQQWWLQARGAVLGVPEAESRRIWRGEALAAFVPSEFSTLRLQYALERREQSPERPVQELFLQAIFSIGPHPAHAY